MCNITQQRNKMSKAVVCDPIFGEQPLIKQVYATLLCTYIWTRKGNSWYDPSYPGYSEKVDRVLQEFERVYLHPDPGQQPDTPRQGEEDDTDDQST